MPRSLDLTGIIPPIPTPFQENEEFYPKALESNLDRWNEAPFRGYLVLGSNGEAVHLGAADQLRVLEVARARIPEDRLMIAGASAQAAKEAIDFLRQAAQIGADAALVGTPSYYKAQMNQSALVNYYTRIADESPLPILLYNVPQFTNVSLSADTIHRLAQHTNVLGLKESAGNLALLGEVFQESPADFQVLCGSRPRYTPR